ncbi:MAG: hypothetical protein HKO57_04835 [Akkermansiaceae bacterium]|nr:hypothetical protein [Akkermansiaceae bacterium]
MNAKDLSEEQVATIRGWAESGAGLSEIQRKLVDDLGLNATYMDTRFLVLDLGIELKAEEPSPEEPGTGEEAPAGDAGAPATPEEALVGQGGSVTVTTDQVARPGAMVSGSVTFSDGEKGVWFIDQMGRPGLDPDTPGYQPSEADLDAFEHELRKALQAP